LAPNPFFAQIFFEISRYSSKIFTKIAKETVVNPHFSRFFGSLNEANSGLRDFDNVDLQQRR